MFTLAGRLIVADQFFTPARCKTIIEIADREDAAPARVQHTTDGARPLEQSDHDQRTDIRDCDIVVASDGGLFAAANRAVGEIVAEIEPLFGVHVEWWEIPQFLRYRPGGHYRPHHDGEYPYPEGWRRISDRDLSVIVFLNDSYTGGHVDFGRLGKVEPEPGRVCVFPSNRYHEHGVMPVLSGVRWTMVTWMCAHAPDLMPSRPPHVPADRWR